MKMGLILAWLRLKKKKSLELEFGLVFEVLGRS